MTLAQSLCAAVGIDGPTSLFLVVEGPAKKDRQDAFSNHGCGRVAEPYFMARFRSCDAERACMAASVMLGTPLEAQ